MSLARLESMIESEEISVQRIADSLGVDVSDLVKWVNWSRVPGMYFSSIERLYYELLPGEEE